MINPADIPLPTTYDDDIETPIKDGPEPLSSLRLDVLVDLPADDEARSNEVKSYIHWMEEIRFDEQFAFLQEVKHGLEWGRPRYFSCVRSGYLVPPDQTLELFEHGDLYIVLNFSIKLRVSSQVLRLASRVFVAMLDSNFKEGRVHLNDRDPPSISFTGDDINAMICLMSILHHKFDMCKKTFTDIEHVIRLAVLADKYNCVNALLPWIEMFTYQLQCHNGFQDYKTMDEVTVSQFLGRSTRYSRATSLLLGNLCLKCEGTPDSPEGQFELLDLRRYRQIDLLGGRITIAFYDSARKWFLGRLLDNLRTVVQLFLDNRSKWHSYGPGTPFLGTLVDHAWPGLGPPDMLSHYLKNYHQYPHNPWNQRSNRLDCYRQDVARVMPSIAGMIKDINHMNHGAEDEYGTQRFPLDGRTWVDCNLYYKGDDKRLLRFHRAVNHALSDASQWVDRGLCIKHARSGSVCNKDLRKCEAYPCFLEHSAPGPLDLQDVWRDFPEIGPEDEEHGPEHWH